MNKDHLVSILVGASALVTCGVTFFFIGSSFALVLAVAVVSAFIITVPVERLALKISAVDYPRERKIHREPVPHLGGIVIYLSFILAFGVQLIWQFFVRAGLHIQLNSQLVGTFLGGTFILIWGLGDDVYELSPKTKFVGQILAALIVILLGVRIEFMANPFGGLLYLGWFSVPISIFWLVGLTNAVNIIDGLDGLASGVVAIALFTLAIFGFLRGQLESVFLCLILVGCCLGFLRHNFNPARIFLGDSGSMFLGFMLAAITAQGIMKSVAILAFLVPIIIMGVPIFDTAFAIFRRYANKKPVSEADQEHIHHRLLYKGFTHRQTVVVIYLWSIVLGVTALVLTWQPGRFTANQKLAVLVFLGLVSFLLARFSGLFDWLRRREYQPKHIKRRRH